MKTGIRSAMIEVRAKLEPVMRRARSSTVVGILAVLLTGCQTIPDLTPWSQATKDVSAAVTEGFQKASSVNGDLARRLDSAVSNRPEFNDPSHRYGAVAQSLAARSADYEQLFGALADYSASLAALSAASQSSQQTVDTVAGSLNQLIASVGGTALAGAGFELGKLLISEGIKVKAAKDFSDAVQKAQPTIDQIAALVDKDLESLQRTVGPSKDEAIRAAIEEPLKANVEYRATLERRRNELQRSVRTAIAPSDSAAATRSLLDARDAPELQKTEQFLRDADAWYEPMNHDLNGALALRATTEDLVMQTRQAIGAWRSSHASLAAAARERRMPQTARLANLAVRIRDLIHQIKMGE